MPRACWTRRRASTAEAATPGVAVAVGLAVALRDGELALVVPQAAARAQRRKVAAARRR